VRLLGARQSLLALATHLDPARYRPIVVVPFSEGGLPEALAARDITTHCVRLGQWRKAKFWPRIPFDLWHLRRLVREEGIDLIHCNEPHVVPYGLRVAKESALPCVGHVRLDNVDERLITNYELGELDCLVAVSEAVARQFDPVWPDRAERVRVIPNGVDIGALRAAAPGREEARRLLSLREGDPLIAQIGLISARKRCHVVIQAFAKIARDFPDARLLFVGSPGPSDEAYAKALTADIYRFGLIARVQMMPFREDIAAVFAAMDLNVLASGQEGFGRVLIEAAVFGVPSIATNVGGIPEVIRHDKTGVLVLPDDPDGLAAAMVSLLRDEPRRRALGEAARRDAEARFSIQTHAEKMMALWDELLG
jgi:glycosyltransferase involved in cell wall biosynthesis